MNFTSVRLVVALPAAILLAGCLGTVADVVTAPVRVVGKTVDLATTSQSKSDEKRGRELRRREERLGELDRDYRSALRDCDDGERKACRRADEIEAEMRDLRFQD